MPKSIEGKYAKRNTFCPETSKRRGEVGKFFQRNRAKNAE
jgi:hypothetical protein